MSSEEAQKSNTLATSNSPILESLYTDPDVMKKFPFMPTSAEVYSDRRASSEGRGVR